MKDTNNEKQNNVHSIRKGLLVTINGTRITVHDDNTVVLTLDSGWAYGNAEELMETVANAITDLLWVFHEITESKKKFTVSYFAKGGGDDMYAIAINVHKFNKPASV